MSFLRRAFGTEERSAPPGYGEPGQGKWQTGMVWQPYGGAGSWSVEQAMRLSAVYACLRILSEAVSTLPLDTFIRLGGNPQPYRPRPPYLSFQPPMGSRITYLSQVMLSMLTDGNAFVATPRNNLGTPLNLIVLDPLKVQVHGLGSNATYTVDDFSSEVFDQFDILHIPGMMMPGQNRGVSPIRAARDVIDGASKAQDYGRAMLGNMGVPPAVISMPAGTGNDPQAEQARARRVAETWAETHGGTSNAGKVGILTGGATLSTIAISPEDGQWLDSKRFGVSEICRFYGVPPHLAADASNSTSWGSGLAEQNSAFGAFSLRPWVERIEDGHSRLLSTDGMPDVYLKLNLDALLRPDTQERWATHALTVAWRLRTPNECRKDEDLPPIPGGDEFVNESPPALLPAAKPKTPVK